MVTASRRRLARRQIMTNSKSWLTIGRWLHRRAENVSVALMGTMFVTFLLQIGFRYLLVRPLSWSEEVCLLCWLWIVLWGSGLVLSDEEEIRFDIIYGAVPAAVRRVFTVITGAALVLLLAISLPASWQYVAFVKREHTASLRIPLNYLYSIYLIFSVALIVRHCRLVWVAVRGTSPEVGSAKEADPA
jgi:TRAP-type C4-dicarboxylate transport system permease small subunit